MSKLKSRTWSSRPSTTQSGVLDYKSIKAKKKRRRASKTRAKEREIARAKDAIRQYVDAENRVNFDVVRSLLDRNPRMTLREAKRLSMNA